MRWADALRRENELTSDGVYIFKDYADKIADIHIKDLAFSIGLEKV